jgi:hypothetical protein
MSSDQQPIHIQLTEEQQEMIHRVTGERASLLELVPDPTDGTSGAGRGLSFHWRISVDSGIPRQQWVTGRVAPPPPVPDKGA